MVKITFYITLATSVLLIVAGFIVPPTGVVDGSVLSAVGELIGFAVIAQLPQLIKDGKVIKTKVGDSLEVTINDNNENKDEDGDS